MSERGLPVRYDLLKVPFNSADMHDRERRSQDIHTLAEPSFQEVNEARQGYLFSAGPYL